ncbi:MAG: AbrB/MazE/SpoVT family DNA-binding domain-containing protein [Thermoprotei archaeon]|nr:MAG: AbrB/MazE/SpoVT family DNA-binding domain-containing protein [Thermoprotei archaeon]
MSEKIEIFRVKMGKRGEIYTTKKIRELAGIKATEELVDIVKKGEIVIKKPVSLEDLLARKTILKIDFEEAEKASEEFQKRYGL